MEQGENYYSSLEDELDVYKAMFIALPQSTFLLDKNKTIIGIFNVTNKTLAGIPINEIVGKSIMVYVNDSQSPIHQVCSMLNSTFDSVLETNVPLKFQYMIENNYMEATISKITGDRILCQMQDISDIVLKQQSAEEQRHKELSMAMVAGGLTSWNYDVKRKMFSSNHDNNVIDGEMTIEDLLAKIEPKDREQTIKMFDDIIYRDAKHVKASVFVRNKQGQIQCSNVHAIPLEYDEYGRVSLIVGSQKDITKDYNHNKELRRLVTLNELILNNTNAGFVYFNPDLEIEWENVSGTFSDKDVVCLLKDNKLCGVTCSMKYVCSRNSVLQSLQSKTRSISKFQTLSGMVIEAIAQPILDDKEQIEGIVLRLDDVTDREETIRELARAKELAEQSDKLKSAFLANMSHEIRTPLNSIVGFAQLIPEAETVEEQKSYIEVVNSNSEMLLKLINDILDLSKIEAGYFNCNNTIFNLSELFRELEVMFNYKISTDVEFRCDIPQQEFFVNLDRLRVSQIITNFMTNAIKFTRKGYIRMGYEVIGNAVKLFVEDTGVGMSMEQSKLVFDRFEKFNKFVQGTGLGTAIAKAIVEAYKGDIGVKSTEGEGSTFWAMLPTNMVSENTSDTTTNTGGTTGTKSSDTREPSEISLLVVEDNDSNYMLIKALLKNYKLTRAVNGLEGVEMARGNIFDIILMDMRMPIMDGITATKTIREFDKQIPIIAVTANAFDEDRKSALDAGANDFLTKPLNKAKLLETLNNYLNQ